MKLICINDQNRPNEIPSSRWIKKGEEYTVVETMKCNVQGGLLGFKLAEIDLAGCEPYLYFAAHRFAPLTKPKAVEEVEELEMA